MIIPKLKVAASLLLQTMTAGRRLLVYIVPVTVISFSLSVPKFMEVLYFLPDILLFFLTSSLFS